MSKNDLIEALKRKTGINDFKSVSSDQFKKIQEKVATHSISREEMQLLIEMMPNFVQLQQNYLDGLKLIINSAKETQKDALSGISKQLENITDLLKNIVDKAETEELRSKIADIALQLASYGVEIARILLEANKDNNSTWKEIAKMSAVVVSVVVGVLAIFSSSNNKKS